MTNLEDSVKWDDVKTERNVRRVASYIAEHRWGYLGNPLTESDQFTAHTALENLGLSTNLSRKEFARKVDFAMKTYHEDYLSRRKH